MANLRLALRVLFKAPFVTVIAITSLEKKITRANNPISRWRDRVIDSRNVERKARGRLGLRRARRKPFVHEGNFFV